MFVDTAESLDPTLPENLVEVGVYDTPSEGFEHGLVILALGRPYWLVAAEAKQRLLVEPDIAASARRHLAAFDRESVGWPPLPVEFTASRRPADLITPVVWAIVVLAVFWGETAHPDWVDAGALDSTAVFQRHEWWRPFTALFLHASGAHLASNALSGVFVFAAVMSTFGRVRGWLSLAVAAVAGNIAAVALNARAPYSSVGASTAVFAGVGLLTGRAARRMVALPRGYRWRAMFTPVAAGITVLALYGAGGVHVDVIAHLTGFISGLLVGFAARPDAEAGAERHGA